LEEVVRKAWECGWIIAVTFNKSAKEWPVNVVLLSPHI
jgi:hypothetical protein